MQSLEFLESLKLANEVGYQSSCFWVEHGGVVFVFLGNRRRLDLFLLQSTGHVHQEVCHQELRQKVTF
jgi:hypothetical protein